MLMISKNLKVAGLAAVLISAAGAAQAQMGSAPASLTPQQVRARILDTCMVARGREVSQQMPIYSGCNCYATGLTKIMDGNDVAAYARTGQVPSRLAPPAQLVYNQCIETAK